MPTDPWLATTSWVTQKHLWTLIAYKRLSMAFPPGFAGAPPGFSASNAGPSVQALPNGDDARMDGNFFGQLTPAEIEKKARKWRTTQKKRFNEKRRRGGGGGVDFGKAVSRPNRLKTLREPVAMDRHADRDDL